MVLVLRVKVPEPGPLIRSARCVGFWIEPKHDASSSMVGESHRTTELIDRREVGRDIADTRHVTAHAEQHLEPEPDRTGKAHAADCKRKVFVYRGL